MNPKQLALLVFSALAISACGGGEVRINDDPDNDGLSNAQEEAIDTDRLHPDTDRDGVFDCDEVEQGLDPLSPDTDGDTLDDGDERFYRTDPFNPDTDGGGMVDGAEIADGRDPHDPLDDSDADLDRLPDAREEELGTDPRDEDTDNDGLSDYAEVAVHGSDPLNPDTDGDGVGDAEEVGAGGNPTVDDTDGDGLTDAQEIGFGTDPRRTDTDGDGLDDHRETQIDSTDPLDADTDDDGLVDGREILVVGSSPLQVDSDLDTILDPDEFNAGTNPQRPDTDGDGLEDAAELLELLTNPLLTDTDGDGLPDGVELGGNGPLKDVGTSDPLKADTDSDGIGDGDEVERGTDPLEADTDGDGLDDATEVFDFVTDPLRTDTDNDGILDNIEVEGLTDPRLTDTDEDGIRDGDEVNGYAARLPDGSTGPVYFSDPLATDTDLDGLPELEEYLRFGTNPSAPDTDLDGLTDAEEVTYRFDPLDPSDGNGADDEDDDTLTNREEVDISTNPRQIDSDFDGLFDADEGVLTADPLRMDTDGDSLIDGEEVRNGTDPLNADTDGDAIPDATERSAFVDTDGDGLVNAADADSDGDGLFDNDEIGRHLTNELLSDTDLDGIPDGREVDWGLEPRDASDALVDSDGDGLLNVEEYRYRSDFSRVDSDADGIPDGVEIRFGLNPADGNDALEDYDHDGINNVTEICPEGALGATCPGASTDPRGSDSDNDGLADSLDSEPNNSDRDGDGLSDGQEVYQHGSDPDVGDSDDDGLDDSVEVDRGSPVRVVDADGDGVLDADEAAAGTDPQNPDSDGDGLTDYAETVTGFQVTFHDPRVDLSSESVVEYARIRVYSDPLIADTDGDGLSDGAEVATLLDPTLADTDNDGLLDGEERDWATDPVRVDTDRDGIIDSLDPQPLDRDGDGDGIADVSELVDGYNGYIDDSSVGALPYQQSFDFAELPAGRIGVAAIVSVTGADPASVSSGGVVELRVYVDGSLASTSQHNVRESQPMSISTPLIRRGTGDVTIEISAVSGDSLNLDRVFAWVDPSETAVGGVAFVPTFADSFDSDGDGVSDGEEAGRGAWVDEDGDNAADLYIPGVWRDVDGNGDVGADELSRNFWLEAEHHAAPGADIAASYGAGNGAVVRETPSTPAFSTGEGAWGYQPGVRYSIFVRARAFGADPTDVFIDGCENDDCPNYLWVTVDRGDSAVDDCGAGIDVCAARVALSDTWEWHPAGTYTPGDRFDITVRELLDVSATPLWAIDRVAIIPLDFAPERGVRVDTDAFAAALLAEGVLPGATMEFDIDLPWGLSDAMESDTDGDGYRADDVNCLDPVLCPDGYVPDSAGLLTDGHELSRSLSNPFDIDSDHDADLLPSIIVPVVGVLFGGDGVFDTASATVELYTDAYDPYPVGTDRDFDGLTDRLEVDLFAACGGTVNGYDCPDAGFVSGTVCNALGTADIRCWEADDDRDNDGIADGLEDANQDGIVDIGETSPNNADSDGDGITDGVERGLEAARSRNITADDRWGAFSPDADPATQTDPLRVDSDGDGLDDGDEDTSEDGAFVADLDAPPATLLVSCGSRSVTHPQTGASLSYTTPQRALFETRADMTDTDFDGLDDRVEREVYCTLPIAADTDDDGISDAIEITQTLSDPNSADTDFDGLLDGDEVRPSTGSFISDPLRSDTDGDGLTDFEEVRGSLSSDPLLTDTDSDGLTDFEEVRAAIATNPRRADTDGDRLSDNFEVRGEDFDGDGVLDEGEDLNGNGTLDGFGTNPTRADTDNDGFRDGEERDGATDPLDPAVYPRAITDAGGLSVTPDEGDIEFETDDDGNRTGVIRVSDARIALACPGRVTTGYLDGTLVIDRSAEDGSQEIYGEGQIFVRTVGEQLIPLWSGRTQFVGNDEETGLPTNTSIAYAPFGADVALSDLGEGLPLDAAFLGAIFFDICEGEIGGFAEWTLGGGGFGVTARSDIGIKPLSLGFSASGLFEYETPIGLAKMTDAYLEVALLTGYASGRGALELPGIGDLISLFPGFEGGSPTEFTIDILNGRYRFRPGSGDAINIGPFTYEGAGGSELPIPEFELDIPRGFFFITAEMSMGKFDFSGDFTFDLAGQIENEPLVTPPDPQACAVSDDCRFGETCVEGECLGCAQQFEPTILDRYLLTVDDVGEIGDHVEITVNGTQYECPSRRSTCALDERIEVGTVEETITVEQNGRLDARELAYEIGRAVNFSSATRCDDECDANYRECAAIECPGLCLFAPGSDDCQACAQADCEPPAQACQDTCVDGVPFEALSVDETVVIESDGFLFDMEISVSVNGEEDEEIIAAEQREELNGHLQINLSVEIPLKQPIVKLILSGRFFADIFRTFEDGDSFFFEVDGTAGLGAELGPVSMGIDFAEASVQLTFNEEDEVQYAFIAANGGITLDDLIGDVAGGLGSIGSEQTLFLGLDGETMGLCGVGNMRFSGWEFPFAFSIQPPVDIATGEFDDQIGGISGGFAAVLPLGFGEAVGYGEVGWDGDFLFSASIDFNLLPGIPLANGEFTINNEGASIAGALTLPGGLGGLNAYGELDWSGRFALDLSGNLTIAGFTLAEVSGSASNDGVSIHGRMALPANLAVLEVDGWVRGDGDFYFRGYATLNLPGGTNLFQALIEISPDGMTLYAALRIPSVTEIIVEGVVRSDGYIRLSGSATLSLGGAVTLGPVTLVFEREVSGTIRIAGSGSLSVVGVQIASVAFSFGTDGAFSASGTIDLWIASVTASISRTASGEFSLFAEARFSVSALEHTLSAVIRASYVSGVVSFYVGGSISGPILNASVGIGVSSNGCFTIDPVGRFCL